MGDVIPLMRRRSRAPSSTTRAASGDPASPARIARVTFYFDVVSPWTYLAAERAERLFGGDGWRPAMGEALAGGRAARGPRAAHVRAAAERRAAELGLPLVWPEGWPEFGRGAMRVASLAAERGRAAPFVLAAGRLAFCGGYELDDPEVIAEAAAAAGLPLGEALAAAGELCRDGDMERTALRLLRGGAEELPATVVGRRLFAGEGRLAVAAAAAAAPRSRRARARSG